MNDTTESGQMIELRGKSGNRYTGKIYTGKDNASSLNGRAIAVLTNSTFTDAGWVHQVNAIYDTENVTDELSRFKGRDDISHLILLSYNENDNGVTDKVDDLVRNYLHS